MYAEKMRLLPLPKGQFYTGCHDMMIGKSSDGVLMRLFYPTAVNPMDTGHNFTRWFLGYKYSEGLSYIYASWMPKVFQTFFNWCTENLRIPATADAPVANGFFPLIIFSHGLSAHRSFYSITCNELASHGFFVAAIEHRDESACATFTHSDNGEKEWMLQRRVMKNENEFPVRKEQVKIRAAECSKALDILERLNKGLLRENELGNSSSPVWFKSKIDTHRPVLVGHSLGGATTILGLSQDKRFRAGVALDPWMYPLKEDVYNLSASVSSQPILIILTEAFQSPLFFKAFQPFDSRPHQFITLKGSVHQSQADTPFLFGFIGRILAGCWSSLDRNVTMSLNNGLILNFLNRFLGKTEANPEYGEVSSRYHHAIQVGLDRKSVSNDYAKQLMSSSNSCENKTNIQSRYYSKL